LHYLLQPVPTGTIVQTMLTHVVKATAETAPRMAWQEVKPDTGPIAAPQ